MELVHQMQSPRYIKTHLPFNLLPSQIKTGEREPKIIYCARNPKDVCVSFYHHRVMTEGYMGSLDEFVDEFIGTVSNCKLKNIIYIVFIIKSEKRILSKDFIELFLIPWQLATLHIGNM